MLGFAEQLVSGMTDVDYLGHGISILHQSSEIRKQYANASAEYNNTYCRQYIDMINESYAGYSSLWQPTAQPPAEPTTPPTATSTSDEVTNITTGVAEVNLNNQQTPPVSQDAKPKRRAKASSMSFLD